MVWWVPQMPMPSFRVPVASLVEAKLLLDTLTDYDNFQLENNVKGDYCNAGGLHVFNEDDVEDGLEGSWVDWVNEDGDTIDSYELADLRRMQLEGSLPVAST